MFFKYYEYEADDGPELKKCEVCGSLNLKDSVNCAACESLDEIELNARIQSHRVDIKRYRKIGAAMLILASVLLIVIIFRIKGLA